LDGGDGNDTLTASGPTDAVDGGAGVDRWFANFSIAGSGMTFVLNTVAGATSTASNGTTVKSIESVDIVGSQYADTITGGNSDDRLDGQDGNDRLTGGNGNDTLYGGRGSDLLDGGAGNDTLSADGEGSDSLLGGDGNDTLVSPNFRPPGDAADVIDGGAGVDLWVADFRLSDSGMTFVLNSAPGSVSTAPDGTTVRNVESIDFDGGNYADIISGGTGNDMIDGWDGNDRLTGGDGNDDLDGGWGDDWLIGGNGNDTLCGIYGNDVMIGGAGQDDLWAGDHSIFRYAALSDSLAGTASRDTILGFVSGTDRLDLAAVDANTIVAGDQGFSFIGAAAFSGAAGQLRYQVLDAYSTVLTADVNGDTRADFEILMQGGSSTLVINDFLL